MGRGRGSVHHRVVPSLLTFPSLQPQPPPHAKSRRHSQKSEGQRHPEGKVCISRGFGYSGVRTVLGRGARSAAGAGEGPFHRSSTSSAEGALHVSSPAQSLPDPSLTCRSRCLGVITSVPVPCLDYAVDHNSSGTKSLFILFLFL